MQLRIVPWLIIWAITLFTIDIHIVYRDGYKLKLNGWLGNLQK